MALGSSQSVGRLLPALVAGYSIGCHEQGRRAYVGLGVITSALVIHEAFDPTLTGWSDYAGARPVAPAVVGRRRAWFVGAYIRARRQLMEELHGRADRAALEEHNRIARELHDVVAHGLAGTRGFRVEAVLPIEVSV